MGVFTHHEACDACGSSDGRAVYEDGSFYCWVCQDKKVSDDYKEEFKSSTKKERKAPVEIKDTKPAVTEEQTAELKSRTITALSGYRSLDPKAFASFGNRAEFDDNDELNAIYYPCTQDNELVGWKCRTLPKEFGKGNLGRTGKTVQLYGQFKFPRPAKYVLIVGGENDTVAAWQMLQEYQRSKGQDFDTPVVAPTIGETGADAQIAAQYTWLDQFETILLGMDNDDAGKKATEKILKVLPRGKVRIVQWSKKDPHEMLEAGMQKQFIKDYYAAKQYVPEGVLGSSSLYDRILAEANVPRIPFPPFAHKLNHLLAGGLTLGHSTSINGYTSHGKTSLVNEFVYHWIFNSPHKVAVMSMELSAAQYGEVMLSRHIQNKLALMAPEDKANYLQTDGVKKAAQELFTKEDGSDRFILMDDRDGDLESTKAVLEQMIIATGAKLVVVDVLSDVLDGSTNDEQAAFLRWIKIMQKEYNVAWVFINHMRKPPAGVKQEGEQGVSGSSTIVKSCSNNIMLWRDKEAEDPVIRNTTVVTLAKARTTGQTGPAGEYYYDNKTHTMYDKEDYFMSNPESMSF